MVEWSNGRMVEWKGKCPDLQFSETKIAVRCHTKQPGGMKRKRNAEMMRGTSHHNETVCEERMTRAS
jgi:hypothetical protein